MRLLKLGEGCLDVPPRLFDLDVDGVTSDSREVRPGFLFVAVSGESTDGHRFLSRAEAAGAVAAVGEQIIGRNGNGREPLRIPYLRVGDSRLALAELGANFYGRPQDAITLTGVTGTKGKTTTTWVLDAILSHAGKQTALLGTVYNRVAGRGYASRNTTPSSLELLRYLHELRSRGGTHAVLEASSHGIAQRRIAGLQFRVGVLTNVAPEHLDYHKTFESYLAVKTRFFEGLAPEAFAVLPRDEIVASRVAEATTAQICWYGSGRPDGVERLRMGPEGLSFRWKGIPVRSRLWGSHNLQNTLAAMTAAECLGLDRKEIAAGVETAVAPPGRLEEVEHGGPFHVFVDYAHTDGALDAVLETLRSITRGRLITVFGCGGDRDSEKRPRMGRVAEKWSHHIVVTSDNPRFEEPEKILEDICAGLERPEDAVFEPDRREAIALGVRMARKGDVILIAGKGHETYQEIRDERLPFDDREVVREFLHEAATLEG